MVYAHMISSIVESGGELPSMILWAAGWPQPPYNFYFPTRRRLRQGDIITTELEARCAGYVAQNTATLCIGRAPDEYHEMFALQQEAVQVCYDMLRPGETRNKDHSKKVYWGDTVICTRDGAQRLGTLSASLIEIV